MNDILIYSVISLASVAASAAVILFIVSKKFHVEEDPRIDEVEEMLPGANCGGCGYAGCRGLAEAIVKAADSGDISGLSCPPAGGDTMGEIAEFLGLSAEKSDPVIAVLKCGGTKEKTTQKSIYDGPPSCASANALYAGESGCPFGCLGLGDCVRSCNFDAIYVDKETGLPVIKDSCVACGACVDACPRNIIEIRPRGRKERRVWINCVNTEKGAHAMKVCKAACIGCGKCVKECPDKISAIKLENNLAYIDPEKCVACGKCVDVCPTKAISATFKKPVKSSAKKKSSTEKKPDKKTPEKKEKVEV